MHIDDFLSRFNRPKKSGKQHMVKCPAHDDRRASLSVSTGDDGKIILKCFANCTIKEITAAMGLREADLFTGNGKEKPKPESRVLTTVCRYDYVDADGKLIYQVTRKSNKSFTQRQPDGKDGWLFHIQGVTPLPYHLPQLLAGIAAKKTVFVVEGEKDVETCESLGLVATCNSGGAGKWTIDHTKYCKDAKVVILPDNDKAGKKHAHDIAEALINIAQSVRIVNLPGLPIKGDISDWVKLGHTTAELIECVKQTPILKTIDELVEQPEELDDNPELQTVSYTDLLTGELQPIDWVVDKLIPHEGITILGGDAGVGKSWVVHHLAITIAAGLPFLGQFPTTYCRVTIFDAESGISLIKRRVKKLWKGMSDHHAMPHPLDVDVTTAAFRLDDKAHEQWFIDKIRADGIGLVIVDPLIHSLPQGANENDSTAMAHFFERVRRIQAATGACFIFVHHSRKQSPINSSNAGQMLRGSSAIRGILDSHIFIRKIESGKLLFEHDKSRQAETLPAFIVSIEDTSDKAIELIYHGPANENVGDLVEVATIFIASAIRNAGGSLARQEIIDAAKAEKHTRRTIDRALAKGTENGLWDKIKEGKRTVYSVKDEEEDDEWGDI